MQSAKVQPANRRNNEYEQQVVYRDAGCDARYGFREPRKGPNAGKAAARRHVRRIEPTSSAARGDSAGERRRRPAFVVFGGRSECAEVRKCRLSTGGQGHWAVKRRRTC